MRRCSEASGRTSCGKLAILASPRTVAWVPVTPALVRPGDVVALGSDRALVVQTAEGLSVAVREWRSAGPCPYIEVTVQDEDGTETSHRFGSNVWEAVAPDVPVCGRVHPSLLISVLALLPQPGDVVWTAPEYLRHSTHLRRGDALSRSARTPCVVVSRAGASLVVRPLLQPAGGIPLDAVLLEEAPLLSGPWLVTAVGFTVPLTEISRFGRLGPEAVRVLHEQLRPRFGDVVWIRDPEHRDSLVCEVILSSDEEYVHTWSITERSSSGGKAFQRRWPRASELLPLEDSLVGTGAEEMGVAPGGDVRSLLGLASRPHRSVGSILHIVGALSASDRERLRAARTPAPGLLVELIRRSPAGKRRHALISQVSSETARVHLARIQGCGGSGQDCVHVPLPEAGAAPPGITGVVATLCVTLAEEEITHDQIGDWGRFIPREAQELLRIEGVELADCPEAAEFLARCYDSWEKAKPLKTVDEAALTALRAQFSREDGPRARSSAHPAPRDVYLARVQFHAGREVKVRPVVIVAAHPHHVLALVCTTKRSFPRGRFPITPHSGVSRGGDLTRTLVRIPHALLRERVGVLEPRAHEAFEDLVAPLDLSGEHVTVSAADCAPEQYATEKESSRER